MATSFPGAKKSFLFLGIILLLIPLWPQDGQMYQVIVFRGRMDDFRSHKLMDTANISPSRYFSHFDVWSERMNVQLACQLPIRRNLQTISSQIPSTYENLLRIKSNLQLEHRDLEFYDRFENLQDQFYDFLGYNPDQELDFQTGLLTSYAYFQYVNRDRISAREFIDIFNFVQPDLQKQLCFLEFSEYMASIFEKIPENVLVSHLNFTEKPEPDTFTSQWDLPYSPLDFLSYNVSLQLSGIHSELKQALEILAEQLSVENFNLTGEHLLFEGKLILGCYHRPLS